MDEQLGAVLAELVARAGAQAARVVDARSGGVLAQVGIDPGRDITALVALARDAVHDQDDLVLITEDGVHVLRNLPGAFLHLRTAAGPGVEAARHEVASAALHRAVEGARRGLAAVGLPRPRVPGAGRPDRSTAPPPRQPALVALGPAAARMEQVGSRAALALEEPAPLPLRAVPQPLALPTVLHQEWAVDADAMGRILDGLRRLN
jgi:hypothetical protein